MAEKQFALSGSKGPEFFAEDDPLAELARIVGYDPKPAAPPVAITPPRREPTLVSLQPAATDFEPQQERRAEQPQHPIFNLEDELLREFEQYDAPRVDADVASDDGADVSVRDTFQADAVTGRVEPGFTAAEYAPADPADFVFHDSAFESILSDDPSPQRLDAPAVALAMPEHQPSAAGDLGRADDAGLADETAQQDLPEWPLARSASDLSADDTADAVDPDADGETSYVAPAHDPVVLRQAAAETFDLADEVELAIAEPVVTPEMRVASRPETRNHLPITNFNVQRSNYRAEPRLEPVAAATPFLPEVTPDTGHDGAADAPAPVIEFDRLADDGDAHTAPAASHAAEPVPAFDEQAFEDAAFQDFETDGWVSAPAETLSLPLEQAGEVLPAVAARSLPAATARGANVDDLLADVDRYPVPEHRPSAFGDEVERPLAAVETPAMTAPDGAAAFEAARSAQMTPALVTSGDGNFGRASARDAAAAEPAFEDPFAEDDFDFDLDNIELDLADMSFDEPEPHVVAEPSRRPVATPLAMPERGRAMAAEPAVRTEASTRPVAFADAFASRKPVYTDPDVEVELPFDASLISDSDEHPESMADMDVPALPVVEPEEPAAMQPEYDIDIDAEMANLFNPADAAVTSTPTKNVAVDEVGFANASWAAASTAAKAEGGKSSFDEFDEFERALEEDFRRTLTQPMAPHAEVEKMTLGPSGYIAGDRRRRVSRGLVVGIALLVVVGAGGGAAAYTYYFGSSDSTAATSTGPRVIVADKDPVKVIPDNPGGKTVPNQDKAVYDRVAGNTAEDPKQGELLSSKEEPIDVVQRTLIPENLPLERDENGDSATATPVGETEDARLLASETPSANPAEDGDKTTGVSPRKVRTMIVKSDGTLVARETPVEPVAETPVIDAEATPTGNSALADPAVKTRGGLTIDTPVTTPAQDLEAAATATVDTPVTAEADASASALAEPTDTDQLADPPVRVVRTTKIADNAPIPESRPVDQPVNVVGTVTDQGNLRPAETETASADPVVQPTATPVAGGYVMQIASLPSEAEAKRSYASLSSKFGGVIGGRGVDIKKAEIAGKGTFYRVRILAGSKDEAAALCVKYRAAGGTCLISK